jgi:hypothetical protein
MVVFSLFGFHVVTRMHKRRRWRIRFYGMQAIILLKSLYILFQHIVIERK